MMSKTIPIYAPVAGEVVPLAQVHDPVFSQEVLGKGVAICPSDGRVCAPCDAVVDTVIDTGHAVNLIADSGAEVLIHVGLDTVELKGRHYTVHTCDGAKVKKGQLLIEFDVEAVKAEGYEVITPVIICNTDEYSQIQGLAGRTAAVGDLIMELKK